MYGKQDVPGVAFELHCLYLMTRNLERLLGYSKLIDGYSILLIEGV